MRILGIDPGTATTGFGVIDQTGAKLNYVAYGVIKTAKTEAPAARLTTIYDELTQLINEHRPKVMAIELLYFAANVTTAMAVSQARGVIMLAANEARLPIFEYTPLQIKQALTNYGRADKAQMQLMVKSILKLEAIPKPDDAADGLAVAICHAARH